jgi:hypothetical protein
MSGYKGANSFEEQIKSEDEVMDALLLLTRGAAAHGPRVWIAVDIPLP